MVEVGTSSPRSGEAIQAHDAPSASFEPEHADTREIAIAALREIAQHPEPAVACSDSAQVIDELLRGIGHGVIADAWDALNREWDVRRRPAFHDPKHKASRPTGVILSNCSSRTRSRCGGQGPPPLVDIARPLCAGHLHLSR